MATSVATRPQRRATGLGRRAS